MDGWHGWQTRKSAHLHASHILPYCSMVALLAILGCENIIASQRKSTGQCAGRGVGTPAPISPAVPHRTQPCSGTWTSRGLSLHTCSKLFWCHAASTVEIRSRGYGPVNLDHPGGPGQPYERSVRVCFSVPGIPVKSWDMSLILGQNFVTVDI